MQYIKLHAVSILATVVAYCIVCDDLAYALAAMLLYVLIQTGVYGVALKLQEIRERRKKNLIRRAV